MGIKLRKRQKMTSGNKVALIGIIFLVSFVFFVIRNDANRPRMNGEVIQSYCTMTAPAKDGGNAMGRAVVGRVIAGNTGMMMGMMSTPPSRPAQYYCNFTVLAEGLTYTYTTEGDEVWNKGTRVLMKKVGDSWLISREQR